jgi:hypothetical protein
MEGNKMSVRLENIDELRRRANVSYEDAKDALEKCNDDLLEALVYLEKQNKVRSSQTSEHKSSFWTKFKELIKKGNNTKCIIHKKENIIISVPVTFAVIITVLAPYIVFIGFIAALFTGHRIKFEGKDFQCSQVNDMLNKVSETVDCAKKKLSEDSSNQTSN